MRKAVVMGEVLTTKERSENNTLYILTKVMPGGAKQDNCTKKVLYDTP